jgi:hypothetical protein
MPPGLLVTGGMKLRVVYPAKGHGVFVTGFDAERAGLRVTNVVGICGTRLADKAGLGRDKYQMILVLNAARFTDRELALVDAGAVRSRGNLRRGNTASAIAARAFRGDAAPFEGEFGFDDSARPFGRRSL